MSEGKPSKMPRLVESEASTAFMARAIELARKAGIEKRSGGCFGAVVVQNDKIVGEGFNQVYTTFDPTCHAEVSAVFDLRLWSPPDDLLHFRLLLYAMPLKT